MARTQSEHYPEIREGILRSAARVFAEKGFSTATIIDLAQACQSSRGALYHYFTSKDAILAAIICEHVDAMLRELEAVGEQRLEPEANLRAIACKIMEMNAVHKHEQIVLLNDWNQLHDGVQRTAAAAQRKIVAIVRDALTRLDGTHRMTPKSATTHAMSLLGSLNYTYAWYDPAGAVTPEDYARQVVDLFLYGFLPRAR